MGKSAWCMKYGGWPVEIKGIKEKGSREVAFYLD